MLLTKRLISGRYQWPRDRREVMDITEEQYQSLMEGFAVEYHSTIEKIREIYL